jgi:stearoyl-CoA desaturase (Delta-9 desaturase)
METRKMKIDNFFKFHLYYIIGLIGIVAALYFSIIYNLWIWLLFGIIYARFTMLFGAHIALHRYFSHNAFSTSKVKHKILCWLSFLSGEGSPIMWFIHHNHHHLHADKELDISSPKEGLLKAFVWNLRSEDHWKKKKVRIFPRKLFQDPDVRFIHDNYFKIWTVISIITFIIDWKIFVFFVLLPIGHNNLISVVMAVLLHVKMPGSYRNFETDDSSWNNQYQVYLMLAEGYHNNHHKYPSRYNQAIKDKEFDLGGYIIEKLFLDKTNICNSKLPSEP